MPVKKNTESTKKSNILKPKKEAPEIIIKKETAAYKVYRRDLALSICNKVRAAGKAVPPKIAEIMVSAYEEAIMEALSHHSEVVLPGFGRYFVVHKPEATRRNPATGAGVLVPAHTEVKFKMGTNLKQSSTIKPSDEE